MTRAEITETLLKSKCFKGIFKINNLPEFIIKADCHHSYTYFIEVDENVCFAVIVQKNQTVVLFNPAFSLVSIPPELLNLCYMYNVITINGDFINQLSRIWYACVYFIDWMMYPLFNDSNIDEVLKIIFPPNSTYTNHVDNINDFLKVKSPLYFDDEQFRHVFMTRTRPKELYADFNLSQNKSFLMQDDPIYVDFDPTPSDYHFLDNGILETNL